MFHVKLVAVSERSLSPETDPAREEKPLRNTWNCGYHARSTVAPPAVTDFGEEVMIHGMTCRAACLLVLTFLISSCSSSTDSGKNNPPNVGAITHGNVYAVTGVPLTLSVSSSDPDPGQAQNHTYTWSVSQGTLLSNNSSQVQWNPGTSVGQATVTVEVSDNIDVSKRSRYITVARRLEPIANLFDPGTVLTEAESPYVITSTALVDVGVGDSLVVEPGAEVLFDQDTAGIQAKGVIRAHGTAAKPIVFSSNRAVPDRGDWVGFISEFQASSLVDLRHCEVSYAKFGVQASPGGRIFVDSCKVEDCSRGGISIGAPNVAHLIRYSCIQGNNGDGIEITTGAQYFVSIERNRIQFNNGHGIRTLASSVGVTILGNSIFKNTGKGVLLLNGEPIIYQNSIQFNDEAGQRLAVDASNYTGPPLDLDASSNFWGTTAPDSMHAGAFILDQVDNPSIPVRLWTNPVLIDWRALGALIPLCN